jgi:putative aldouronate transport system permease protein
MANSNTFEQEKTRRLRGGMARAKKLIRKHWQFYLFIAPAVAYILIFKYVPMVGAQIAFRDYSPTQGIWGSEWVGLREFSRFINSPNFWILIRNTLSISVLFLTIGFISPITLALALNEVRTGAFKKTVQMVTYAPHFISTVVMSAMIIIFLNPRIGFIGKGVDVFTGKMTDLMGISGAFKYVYVFSDIWQHAGYAAIIYMAALSGISPALYEAAKIDGASRLQKIRHIDFPGILPTVTILLILQAGEIMNVGFEKVYLLQNPLNLPASEIIATYVYKIGIINASFSFGAAVGLFNSVINFALLITVNSVARRVTEHSLW